MSFTHVEKGVARIRISHMHVKHSDTVGEIVHSLQNRMHVLFAEIEEKRTISTTKIKKSLGGFLQTSQQLLQLSRIGAGVYEQTSIDLSELVVREIGEFTWWCDMQHIELSSIIESGIVYTGNASLLAELVRILMHNATKYRSMERNAVVFVILRKGPPVTIEVIDNGIGIPQEDVAHIFERWFRSPAVLDSHEGTGLGLAVAQQITVFHHATITVQSTWGSGTRMSVEL